MDVTITAYNEDGDMLFVQSTCSELVVNAIIKACEADGLRVEITPN